MPWCGPSPKRSYCEPSGNGICCSMLVWSNSKLVCLRVWCWWRVRNQQATAPRAPTKPYPGLACLPTAWQPQQLKDLLLSTERLSIHAPTHQS